MGLSRRRTAGRGADVSARASLPERSRRYCRYRLVGIIAAVVRPFLCSYSRRKASSRHPYKEATYLSQNQAARATARDADAGDRPSSDAKKDGAAIGREASEGGYSNARRGREAEEQFAEGTDRYYPGRRSCGAPRLVFEGNTALTR